MSPSWISNSHFYSTEVIENSNKVISSDSDNDSTYTNLSKMRSYLKRCESAISNISLNGKRSTQKMSDNIRTKQSSSSWYIENIDGPKTEICNEHCSELNDIENEIASVKCVSQSMHSLTENQTTNTNNEYLNNHSEIDFVRPICQPVSMILGKRKKTSY